MTNNELLLDISNILDEKNKPIYQRFERLENELRNGLSTLDRKIDNVQSTLGNDIQSIKLILENEIRPNIKLLAENYPDLEAMRNTVEYNEMLKTDVELLKKVVAEHSEQIQLQKIS